MKHLCPFCEEYARGGHNYCRMCGSHLTVEQPQRPEVAAEFEAAEKYCGHCGRNRLDCSGGHAQ
jgi:hypothetical protein